MLRLPYIWIFVLMFFIATCCSRIIEGFWFFSCPHGNGQGQAGDVCSAFCRCHPLNTCEAGIQRCARPGVYGERCHATRPCGTGLSCHPGVQKCFHVLRRYGEPCVAGYECRSGLSCEPGVQLCFHHPRLYNEPCSAGFSCSQGLSCQPGYQRCLHHPRRENERCSAGYACANGLVCRLCDKPYATCQLARVPALTEQDYERPFNKVAFLVTHNSFSNSPSFAVWARNQRFSVSQQLKDGVRGLMLDIYPGWGDADVRLCHASCFWSGSTNLLDTLIEIRKFMETNEREVITIIFEDYLKNPTILRRVFDEAGISPHVLRKENWGDGFNDWPTLTDMRRLGRLVVFNNNGLSGFPYTEFNMWHYVRENRYGNAGQNRKECIDRQESRWNKDWNDRWSLILINWFSTAGNPLQPCLNSFSEIRDKLVTCHGKFGFWANFVAVNFYTAGSGGGAFQAVKWLNNMFRADTPFGRERKASFIPFPLIDTVNHSASKTNQQLKDEKKPIIKNTIDEHGYGSGFHDLSDIITHILENQKSWVRRNSISKNPATIDFSADVSNFNPSSVSRAVSNQSHNNKRSKLRKSPPINKVGKMLPGNIEISNSTNRLSPENLEKTGNLTGNESRKLKLRHRGSQRKFALILSKSSRQHSPSTARLSLSPLRHNTTATRKINLNIKLRNLRKQLARLKTKLNKYIHSAHPRRKKQTNPNVLFPHVAKLLTQDHKPI